MTYWYDPKTSAITGRMFLDTDGDNTEFRASGGFEPGLAGQTVTLLNAYGHVIATTTTDAHGVYSFTHLASGDYIIKFPTEIGDLSLVEKDVGSIDGDSDADVDTGKTIALHLPKATTFSEIDAGYVDLSDPAPGPDFIVEGTSGADVIDAGYAGDPEGDLIDAGDNTTGTDADVVDAGAGDDTVLAGAADDTVFAGSGDDSVEGSAGHDVIFGDQSLGQADGEVDNFPEWPQDISNIVFYFDTDGDGEVDRAVKVDDFPDGEADKFISNDLDVYFDQILKFVQDADPALSGLEPVIGVSIKGGLKPTQFFAVNPDDSGAVQAPSPLLNAGPGTDLTLSYSDFFETYEHSGPEGPGDDTLSGGVGDDLIYGETGDDSILGGSGNDTLFGDDAPLGTPIGPNLIVNGSFEDTSGMTTTGYGFVAADGEITGWTDTSGNEIDVHNDGRGGQVATDGENWLDLEASPGNNRVGQDVAGVQDGVSYRLTFDVSDSETLTSADGPTENLVNVYWGGVLVATIDPSNVNESDFETITLDLIGGAGDGSNRLEFEGLGQEDNFGASIDNVSLVQLSDVTGPAGNDTIDGGDGDDLIAGQGGNDDLSGGLGNDTILGGAGDTIVGGDGDDSIVIDPTLLDATGEATAAISVDGSTEGTDRDTLDLTSFVAYRNLVQTPDADGDSTSGALEVQNADGDWVPVTFTEIETLMLPPRAPDGVVDGEETGELMNPGYDDADGPTDGGGDIIDGPDGLDDSIRGNGGDDTINAGAGNDTVDGGIGNDEVNGGTGNDLLDGGAGDDLVTGGFGDDTVLGGDGNDELRGNDGNDSLDGGAGNDSMGGAEGNDTIQGGAGNDTLSGGSGDDVLDGGAGADTINGNSGNDVITDLDGDNLVTSGADGAPDRGLPFVGFPDADPLDDRDTITTGDGNDTIFAGDDNDVIDAGNGDNVIDAGFDDDSVTSGDGNDLITSGEGSDTITSGGGDDTIYGGLGPVLGISANLIDDNVNPANNDPILDNGDDLIDAGDGNDLVFGEDDNDTISGGAGNDTLDGGIDDDVIDGGTGDDLVIGGQGADSLSGGEGDDTFTIGDFTDPIFGDIYKEGIGDTITGGEDPDDNDIDVLDLSNAGPLKIIFDDAIDPLGTSGESGKVIFYKDAAQTEIAGELIFKEIENVIPCFTPGTLIATPRGEVPVESLRVGDKVITRDNGIQEIRWVGSRTLDRAELAQNPNFKPILVKKGSLGHGLPERDMIVSPQHRLLVANQMTELYFNETEVLVPAKHMVDKWGVSQLDTLRTTYIHFMFDRHEVVLSNGCWTESFQPGLQSMSDMGDAVRDEIFALFPELKTREGIDSYTSARRSLKSHEAKLLQL